MKTITAICSVSLMGLGLSTMPLQARPKTLFGEPGTGQPTNTVGGIVAGAATGAAIGQAVGGKDGWWIGSLVGSMLGGAAGNSIPTEYSSHRYYESQTRHHQSYSRHPVRRHVYYSNQRTCDPVIIERKTVVVEKAEAVPYGYMLPDGRIRSPWSNFEMSVGGKAPGQVVYDANTGQGFRIP